MSHDGGPNPMYWVIWSVSESPDFSRFSVHNMGFQYCPEWFILVFRGEGMVAVSW